MVSQRQLQVVVGALLTSFVGISCTPQPIVRVVRDEACDRVHASRDAFRLAAWMWRHEADVTTITSLEVDSLPEDMDEDLRRFWGAKSLPGHTFIPIGNTHSGGVVAAWVRPDSTGDVLVVLFDSEGERVVVAGSALDFLSRIWHRDENVYLRADADFIAGARSAYDRSRRGFERAFTRSYGEPTSLADARQRARDLQPDFDAWFRAATATTPAP